MITEQPSFWRATKHRRAGLAVRERVMDRFDAVTRMTVLHTARKRSVDPLSLVVDALRNPAAVQQLL